jgi:methylase of polypeptide subunit release factors
LLENALNILKSEDCLSQLKKRSDFGATADEQYYNVTLELVITWINRILFLKLLEGQLKRYNGGDKNLSFLNSSRIEDFDELNKLFFRVLAVKEENRSDDIRKKYAGVPFLNSSLFEPTIVEHGTIRINSLDDNITLPLLSSTVLKDRAGKKISGSMKPLDYLFAFLDAYDFSSEGSEDIQEENKTLINASVLGLIFEKINGYKDGSFFTPGFITMYMCHETITRAVVQKFNESKGWSCETITDIYNKNPDIAEANRIINSLKICDPAVGSGHFLVSALNEIIAIKSELGILADKNGKLLRDFTIEVINDELVITDSEGRFFEYNPKNKESQRVQETLFREKQTIIENCLFGVDINPNSVKICRLRLWIELLKNAYYKIPSLNSLPPAPCSMQLETLPNIDINIKCGNSLISRYSLDADIRTALRSSKWTVDNYREAVMTYRNAQSKEEKRSMEELIEKIKTDFETEIAHNDKRFLKLNKLKGEMMSLSGQTSMFELSRKEKEEWNKKLSRLTTDIQKVESELSEIKNNKIFENVFEWRFEFPEVLSNDGDFVGFDVVIGNPPYLSGNAYRYLHKFFNENYEVAEYQLDLYTFFIELSERIMKLQGVMALITPNSWLKNLKMLKTRKYVLSKLKVFSINPNISKVFEEAQVDTLIFIAKKSSLLDEIDINTIKPDGTILRKHKIHQEVFLKSTDLIIDTEANDSIRSLIKKIRANSVPLEQLFEITRGVNPYDKYRGQSEETIKNKVYHCTFAKDSTFRPELRGKHVGLYHYRWDEKHYISYGDWLAAPRDPKFFTGDRIIFREILGRRFVCAFIEEDFIIDRSLYIAKPKNSSVSCHYILGLLASKLLIWLFRHEKNEFDDLFPKIRLEEFKNLPINNNESLQGQIESTVKQLILRNNSGIDEEIIELEEILDHLTYQIFGLSDEEIMLIEESNSNIS